MINKADAEEKKTDLELYFHIPFCVKKCAYCDFLSAEAEDETKKAYMKRLTEDMEQFPHKETYRVTSVFLGGGTPTVAEAEDIAELLHRTRDCFSFAEDVEITIEANPKTVQSNTLRLYRKAGVNRISFGLQSVHEKELRTLGRIHSYEEFLESFYMAEEAGFTNRNIDLMFAIPGQTLESWQQTLQTAAELGTTHISAYSLMIEEGTPFYAAYREDLERRERGELPELLPTEETEERMYADAVRILKEYGYERYEISNFAKEGFACKHNEGYWTGTPYAGFGLGAASYIENRRFVKTRRMEAYLEGDFSEREREFLSEREQMAEFMILGLRRTKGVSTEAFRERFRRPMPEHYRNVIADYSEKGFLQEKGGWISFTERGTLLSNRVLSEFLDDR